MFNKNKVKLGIAPIAWTNDDLPDLGKENTFEQCVSEMALAGFTGSEVGNKYPKDPEVLREALELRGMEICNQWFSSFLITKPFEEVEKEFRAQLAFLKAMGAKIIGASEQSHSVQGMQDTPIFGHKYVMNDQEWETFCTGMNRLGKIAKEEYGISLTFHHHMGTVVQNPDEVERMMENTDPEYVSLLFDTGHFTYCGADPLEMVKKYVGRIKHVHLKDIRPEVVEKVKKENLSFLEDVYKRQVKAIINTLVPTAVFSSYPSTLVRMRSIIIPPPAPMNPQIKPITAPHRRDSVSYTHLSGAGIFPGIYAPL